MHNLENLQPQAVFHWFHELNQIPRGSGNEQAVSDWLREFAEARNLEVEQDQALNIIIRKAGSKGYENAPLVAIQGHMDMVCEKTADSSHDFLKDPIEMWVDGDWLKANKTTLGGDDGIAVAYALALLDAKDIAHPPLEVIITTSEETGMDGAQALRPEQIKAKYLLNIDSDDEGLFILGCAGGADLIASFDFAPEKLEAAEIYRLSIAGLKGGHSGQMIGQGLGNAIKILARCLHGLNTQGDLRLVSIEGGTKHNAIPTAATALFAATPEVKANLEQIFADIQAEYAIVDPDLHYSLEKASASEALSAENSKKLIDYLFVIPHGVQAMSHSMHGLVQTSLNIAILKEVEGKQVLQVSIRSALNSAKHELVDRLITLSSYFGGKAVCQGEYPAWEYKADSSLISRVQDIYQEMYQKEPEITAIHAGLECGLLGEILPETEMISFGPNMQDIHTPRERLSIASTQRTWEFLLKLLASFKA